MFLNRTEASGYLAAHGVRIAAKTLANWASSGKDGPPFVYLGSKPYYSKDDLENWLNVAIDQARTHAKPKWGQQHG